MSAIQPPAPPDPRILVDERGELPGTVRQILLPIGAKILDDRAFERRFLASLQHTVYGYRHTPQRMKLRHQAAESFRAALVGLVAECPHQFGKDIDGFEETFRSAPLVGQLARRLLPGGVDLAKNMIVGHESVFEHDLVEFVNTGHVTNGVHRDTRRVLHVDQELRQAVPPVLFGRRRSPEEADHIIGVMRIAGPDLGAVDQPTAIGFRRACACREQVGTRTGFAHTDAETAFAARNPLQDIHLDIFRRVLDQHRPTLPIGREMQPGRRTDRAKFFGHDITLQEAAFLPAIFLRPSQAKVVSQDVV